MIFLGFSFWKLARFRSLYSLRFRARNTNKELRESGVTVSGIFRNDLSNSARDRALQAMVELSNLGNVIFLNQELAKEGILPLSHFFAYNKLFNAPHAGQAYEYIVDLYTYPAA